MAELEETLKKAKNRKFHGRKRILIEMYKRLDDENLEDVLDI